MQEFEAYVTRGYPRFFGITLAFDIREDDLIVDGTEEDRKDLVSRVKEARESGFNRMTCVITGRYGGLGRTPARSIRFSRF